MVIVAVLLAALVGAAVGLAIAFVVVRSIHSVQRDAAIERDAARAERDAAVAGAVTQLSTEVAADLSAGLSAGLAADREQTVQTLLRQLSVEREQALQTTIDMVMSVAGDKLGSHTTAASTELGLRSEMFDQQVTGMNDELRQVRRLVAELQKEKAEQHGQIVQGINEAVRASAALADTTQHLREALSNSRARGQWGERMAEDVLRSAGFIEGINYRTQQTLAGGGRPDLTFLLPRDRVLHMDVKFPIDNYLRHLEAETDAERDAHAKAFLRDVRSRIKELTARDYIDADTTVGYVLLFIPNESVYSFIHQYDHRILDESLRQQVVLCSPFSLFAVLGVVRQAVDNFLVERTSDEILQTLGGFTKQWNLFSEKVDRLGAQFATAQKTYDELAGTRRRQLQKQLDHVDRLRDARGLDDLDQLDQAKEAGAPLATVPRPAAVTALTLADASFAADDDEPTGGELDDDPDHDANDADGSALDRVADDLAAVSGEARVAHPASARRVPRLRPLR